VSFWVLRLVSRGQRGSKRGGRCVNDPSGTERIQDARRQICNYRSAVRVGLEGSRSVFFDTSSEAKEQCLDLVYGVEEGAGVLLQLQALHKG